MTTRDDDIKLCEVLKMIKEMNNDIENILNEFTENTGLQIVDIYITTSYFIDVGMKYDVDVVVNINAVDIRL